MAQERGTEGAERLTEAFGESYQAIMRNAVEAQQRNVGLAQGWVESLTELLRSQAETNRALTKAMESYVSVVDEAVKSQERTSRALAESVESYKEVIERVETLQEKSNQLTGGFFERVTGELQSQSEANQAVARGLLEGSEKQWNAFQKMFEEAMESYTNLLSAPFALYQKGLESTRERREE
jgi:ABC-type transporter Mla subunit MlaD